MKTSRLQTTLRFVISAALALMLIGVLTAVAQDQSKEERLASLKASLALSQENLRTYEWIETTAFNLKGEEKSRKQSRCYYGADGSLQKVEENSSADEGKKKRGLRGKIAESKKDDLLDYTEAAVALVKSYVPLDPAKLQAVSDAGKVSLDITEPGKRARLNFRDYNKPGDVVSVEIDLTNNSLLGFSVKTFFEKPDDAVTLDARFAKLNDGTTYADEVVLNAPGKEVKIVVDNSGYRKLAG